MLIVDIKGSWPNQYRIGQVTNSSGK